MAQPSLGRHQTDRQGERGSGKAQPPPLFAVAQVPWPGNFHMWWLWPKKREDTVE